MGKLVLDSIVWLEKEIYVHRNSFSKWNACQRPINFNEYFLDKILPLGNFYEFT